MAKVVIEIEDLPNGEVHVRFAGDGLRTAATTRSNTTAQNAAIYLAEHMRAVGLDAPDLSGQSGRKTMSNPTSAWEDSH